MSDFASHRLTPTSLKNDGGALVIEWADGARHRLSWKLLREACPCATCRTRREAPPEPQPLLPVLSPAEARPLRPVGMRAVGNYAYAIEFSDGHGSGIYALDYLRQLGEQMSGT